MDGEYNIEGKCVRCNQYHPCDCEVIELPEDDADEQLEIMEKDLIKYLNDCDEER